MKRKCESGNEWFRGKRAHKSIKVQGKKKARIIGTERKKSVMTEENVLE